MNVVNFQELEPYAVACEYIVAEHGEELKAIATAIVNYQKSKDQFAKLRIVQMQQQLFAKMSPASLTDRSKPAFAQQACLDALKQLWTNAVLNGGK